MPMFPFARAKHAAPRSALGAGLALAVGVATAVPLALTSTAGTAAAADACLVPQVRDAMVSQGLPSYAKLTSGKTALVKYFLSAPSCAPAGASIRITGGSLSLSTGGAALGLNALLPLPPVGPASVAPIPAAESDPLFVVPGSRLSATLTQSTVSFTATLSYTSTTAAGTTQSGQLQVSKHPNGSPVQAVVERRSNPLRVGVFAMGNAGTVAAPATYTSQFPTSAEAALQEGMSSLHRSLPLADGVGSLKDTSAGLRWNLNAGLIDLSTYMGAGSYCGRPSHFPYISKQLETARTNWNSANPTAKIDLAYGVVDETISSGPSTGGSIDCVEGYATVGGTVSWGRVIQQTATRPGITGTIAAMELLHNTGAVASNDPRYDGGFHSRNLEADGTARDRAWNTKAQKWIAADRSALRYETSGWNDGVSLLEKPDWDLLQCQLTPAPLLGGASCAKPGSVGTAAASAGAGSAFFVSGSTDGTPEGTDAHTYLDDDVNYESPDPAKAYTFVQRNAIGGILRVDGIRVTTTASHHHGSTDGLGQVHTDVGSFGTEVPAHDLATRIQLYKGDPSTGPAVLLHERDRNVPPRHASLSVSGRGISVAVADEVPANVRLDVFYRCPDYTYPMANALKPVVVGPLAVFVTSLDSSLGCANGRYVYRASDGYLTAEQVDSVETTSTQSGEAAIYSPTESGVVTAGRNLALSGSGRDAAGNDAAALVWSLQGPSFPSRTEVARGAEATVVPPAGGFEPGRYTLALQALAADGSLLAETSLPLEVRSDRDLDGMSDADEQQPCYGTGAADDPSNASQDSDGDGHANVVDPEPCVADLNLTVRTFPDKLLKTSAGSPVTVEISGSPVDLRTMSPGDLHIVQAGGYPTDFAAYDMTVHSATSATLKFDRPAINAFLTQRDLLGYVPFFIGTTSGSLRGVDATYPVVFP